MAIHKVSYKKEGNKQLTTHIKLKDLKCKDGSDIIIYYDETLLKIEELIKITGSTGIIITSGYRTPSYNKKIGGASKSSHTEGYAIDFNLTGCKYDNKQVTCMMQDLGFEGIGYISKNGLHGDMKYRKNSLGKHYFYRGDERKGYTNNVGGDFYTYWEIKKGSLPTSGESKIDTSKFPVIKRSNSYKYVQYVRQMQQKLNEHGFKGANKKALTIDGKWGDNTDYSLADFQKKNGLKVDKICGKNTWKQLYK